MFARIKLAEWNTSCVFPLWFYSIGQVLLVI